MPIKVSTNQPEVCHQIEFSIVPFFVCIQSFNTLFHSTLLLFHSTGWCSPRWQRKQRNPNRSQLHVFNASITSPQKGRESCGCVIFFSSFQLFVDTFVCFVEGLCFFLCASSEKSALFMVGDVVCRWVASFCFIHIHVEKLNPHCDVTLPGESFGSESEHSVKLFDPRSLNVFSGVFFKYF